MHAGTGRWGSAGLRVLLSGSDPRDVQAGIAKQDFQQAARGRVAFEGGANIRPESGEYAARFEAQAV